MKLKLDFGSDGLWIEVPDKNLVKVLAMKKTEPITNPNEAVAKALENPIASDSLADLAKGKESACVVICDITRPVPNKILLPPILDALEKSGIKREKITILIATGIHRPNLGDELIQLVGEEIASKYNVVNHYAKRKEDQTYLGKTSRNTEVFINSDYLNADLKITTGFIEPHLMAGFSGGRKLICPGIASLETVKVMHSPKILEHPNAREGVIEGNPFHEEVIEMIKMAGMDFMLNVALNENRNIVGIFAGDYIEAHKQGVVFVRDHVGDSVPEPVDIVVTSSAGAPLDATFYQSVKGMTAALPIVKQSGTIIIAAECKEGLGGPEFSQLVRETEDMDVFRKNMIRDDYFVVDQWQFEELAKVLKKADVYLYSTGLSGEDIPKSLLTIVESVEAGIEMALKKYGENAKIAVIPKGPYVLAEVKK
ncbi:nickel-dependent lactate racemase [candidate division KSB1 bacterium]|nr:nickel-dependent lactate racemase [candidate division KSB1 bacterium]